MKHYLLVDVAGIGSDDALAIDGATISWVGRLENLPETYRDWPKVSVGHAAVLPGLIDCHTHLVFAGTRSHEYVQRADGASYLEIMQAGGGILSTVQKVRGASEESLIELALPRLRAMLRHGVTLADVKSGYGLDVENELKMLRVIKKLNELQPVELVPCFLGAHTIAPEYASDPDGYVDLLTQELLPEVARHNLAHSCDVFVEKGAFSLAQAERILTCARDLGFVLKMHAEQLTRQGSVALAARLGVKSVSHLEQTTPADLKMLSEHGIVAELLPLAQTYLGMEHTFNARGYMDLGGRVAVATDYNPGTAMCSNLQWAMRLAVSVSHLTCQEALDAVTLHAASALDKSNVGALSAGMQADLCVLKNSVADLFYDWDHNPVDFVIKKGQVIRS